MYAYPMPLIAALFLIPVLVIAYVLVAAFWMIFAIVKLVRALAYWAFKRLTDTPE